MTTYRIRILHVSDLHERVLLDWMPEDRKQKILNGAAQRHRVLGDKFQSVLETIHEKRPIDIVCFTGDIADWGLPEEYARATKRMETLLEWTGVDKRRFFPVPGNHDVNRSPHGATWSEMRKLGAEDADGLARWMAGQVKPRGTTDAWPDELLQRTNAFWTWVDKDLGRTSLLPGAKDRHPRLGYREALRFPDLPFDVHIVGLDSAWLAGDDHDAKKLRLTSYQINRLARDVDGEPLPGFRLALVHHPLGELADEEESTRLLAESVHLLLHGHQHKPMAKEQHEIDLRLPTLAAGSLFEGDYGDKWTNAFNVIDVQLDDRGNPVQYDVEFWGWSERGFWHKNGAIYEHAGDGRLKWKVGKKSPNTKGVGRGRSPSTAPPANPSKTPTRTSIVLDRIDQWTTILNDCASRNDHQVFVVHGTKQQDLSLFIQRIKSYLHEECKEPPHRAKLVEYKNDRSLPTTADEWKRPILEVNENKGAEFRIGLPRETRDVCPVYVLTARGGGPLRNLNDAAVDGLVSLFCDQLDDIVNGLVADGRLKHPLRFVIPVEHETRGGSPQLTRLNKGLSRLRTLKYMSLREVDFPPWDEVWADITSDTKGFEGAKDDADLQKRCKNAYDTVEAHPQRTLQMLGDALHRIVVVEWEPEQERKRWKK